MKYACGRIFVLYFICYHGTLNMCEWCYKSVYKSRVKTGIPKSEISIRYFTYIITFQK